jgi:hypothetical protein
VNSSPKNAQVKVKKLFFSPQQDVHSTSPYGNGQSRIAFLLIGGVLAFLSTGLVAILDGIWYFGLWKYFTHKSMSFTGSSEFNLDEIHPISDSGISIPSRVTS